MSAVCSHGASVVCAHCGPRRSERSAPPQPVTVGKMVHFIMCDERGEPSYSLGCSFLNLPTRTAFRKMTEQLLQYATGLETKQSTYV